MKIKAKMKLLKGQLEFINIFTKPVMAFVGGFGSGKTQGIFYRCLKIFQHRKNKAKIIITEPTWGMVTDTLIPMFESLFSQFKIKYSWTGSSKRRTQNCFTTRWGQILVRSGKVPKRIKGIRDVTDWITDEIDSMPQDNAVELQNELIARGRGCKDSTGGHTSTPEGINFLYAHFDKLGEKYNPDLYYLIRASTKDNYTIGPEYYLRMIEVYGEELAQQYVDGLFINIRQGQVYYNFSEKNKSLSSRFVKGIELIACYDFNVNPFSIVIGQYLRSIDEIHFFDEIYLKNSNTENATIELANRYKGRVKNLIVYGDAAGHQRNTKGSVGETDYTIIKNILREHFNLSIKVPRHHALVRDKTNSCNIAFKKLKVIFNPVKCKKTVFDFERVTHKEGSNEIDKKNKWLTHLSDAASYGIDSIMPVRIKSSSIDSLLGLNQYRDPFQTI